MLCAHDSTSRRVVFGGAVGRARTLAIVRVLYGVTGRLSVVMATWKVHHRNQDGSLVVRSGHEAFRNGGETESQAEHDGTRGTSEVVGAPY